MYNNETYTYDEEKNIERGDGGGREKGEGKRDPLMPQESVTDLGYSLFIN